jgi:hypothetical protein
VRRADNLTTFSECPGLSLSGGKRQCVKTHECRGNQKQNNSVRRKYTKFGVEYIGEKCQFMTNRFPAYKVQIFVCLIQLQFCLTHRGDVQRKLNYIKTLLCAITLYLTFSFVNGCAHFVVLLAGLILLSGLSSDNTLLTYEKLLSKLLYCYSYHELGGSDRRV